MKILIVSTYFKPYSSGLSVYAERLAKGLAKIGHEVVVLTSKYQKQLDDEQQLGGIKIVRIPVLCKFSKGVIMPGLPAYAMKWINWADMVNLHLPQFESFVYSLIAKQKKKPLLITYHCDLVMTGNWIEKMAGWFTRILGKKSLRRANLIVQNSLDYAHNSSELRSFLAKVVEILPPIEATTLDRATINKFKQNYNFADSETIIGLAGRVASEKGYEYLIDALPIVLEKHPEVRVVHAGAWDAVIGERSYQEKIEKMASSLGEKWKTLGFLSDEEFMAFFGACSLMVYTSLNATESFGIVQLEALSQGTPIIASNLPGVRQPVINTGLGKIVEPKDVEGLANAIIEILDSKDPVRTVPQDYLKNSQINEIARRYDTEIRKLVP